MATLYSTEFSLLHTIPLVPVHCSPDPPVEDYSPSGRSIAPGQGGCKTILLIGIMLEDLFREYQIVEKDG